MSKYIDVDLLRKEIKFAKSVYSHPNRVIHGVADGFRQDGRAAMCDDILKKIDSLQQERPSEDFEKELAKVIVDVVESRDGEGPSLKDYAKRLFVSAHSAPFTLEQPDVDLEKDMEKWRHTHFNGERDGHYSGEYLTRESQLDMSRYFYELGQRRAAEMYDEIEYNRQRAEEESK